MPKFDPATYDFVADRLKKFWADHPDGSVISKIIPEMSTLDRVVFYAEVYYDKNDSRPAGADCAYGEIEPSDYKSVNHKSWMENASTSAIGRALANCTYLAKIDSPRPSYEEMDKAGALDRERETPPQRQYTRQGPPPKQTGTGGGERFPDAAPRGTKTPDVVAFFRKHGFKGEGGVTGMIQEVEQTYKVQVQGTAPDGGHYPSDAYNALAYFVAQSNAATSGGGDEMDDVPF